MMMDATTTTPFVDTERYCSRGLEYKTPRGMHIRNEHKIHALETVLVEQELQWELGIDDPDHLAELCGECARQSLTVAHLVAIHDEDFVHEEQERHPLDVLGLIRPTLRSTTTGSSASRSRPPPAQRPVCRSILRRNGTCSNCRANANQKTSPTH